MPNPSCPSDAFSSISSRMNFPAFWAKGTASASAARGSKPFSAWRWSNVSMAEAQAVAEKAARELAERFARTGQWPQHEYGYLDDRPVREPVLREIKDESGQLAAVVTRNGYGATVLNCARAMFLDVDLSLIH